MRVDCGLNDPGLDGVPRKSGGSRGPHPGGPLNLIPLYALIFKRSCSTLESGDGLRSFADRGVLRRDGLASPPHLRPGGARNMPLAIEGVPEGSQGLPETNPWLPSNAPGVVRSSELLTWSRGNLSQSGVGIGIGIAIDPVSLDSDADTDPDPVKKRTYFGAHPCPKKDAIFLKFRGHVRRSEL